jgi:hypothetical protein
VWLDATHGIAVLRGSLGTRLVVGRQSWLVEGLAPVDGPASADSTLMGELSTAGGGRVSVILRFSRDGELSLSSLSSGGVGRYTLRPVTCAACAASQREADEAAAIKALRALHARQRTFAATDADGDGVPDYGTLPELSRAGLLEGWEWPPGLPLEVATATGGSGPVWAALASPRQPSAGARWLFVDHTGALRESDRPLQLDPGCAAPADARPLAE